MNALIVKGTPDGVKIELQVDESDKNAALFARWLNDLIHKAEELMPEVEVKQ